MTARCVALLCSGDTLLTLYLQEEIVFPFLNQKMDFAPEKEAHEVIHKGISDLEAILLEAKADPSKFNPDKIKEFLVQLKGPLVSMNCCA